VRKGLQYIFAPASIRYGMTAELVLRTEDIDKVAEFIRVRRAAYTLDKLLADFDPDAYRDEAWDRAPPVGREVI
jgi:hypothetical protein